MKAYRIVCNGVALAFTLSAGVPSASADRRPGDEGRWHNTASSGRADRDYGKDNDRLNSAPQSWWTNGRRGDNRRWHNAPPVRSADRSQSDQGRWNNAPAYGPANRGGHNGRGHNPSHKPPSGYQVDRRYHHDRYYPPRGYATAVLPPGHRVVRHKHTHYYYHGGVWYHASGVRFVVVTPPLGIVVPVLPPFYTTIWVRGLPYYYANGVYYAWSAPEPGYIVVKAPPESEVATVPSVPEQLFVYPKKGQGEQQRADDRYACHRWAVGETGFDPSQPSADLSDSQLLAKRADYQRAMKACLEAREYSVK